MIADCDYKIIPYHEHFVVYFKGKFLCTADTWKEAAREIELHKH